MTRNLKAKRLETPNGDKPAKRRRIDNMNGRVSVTLPDVVWTNILVQLESANDRMRVGAVSRRLEVLSKQRQVWKRFAFLRLEYNPERADNGRKEVQVFRSDVTVIREPVICQFSMSDDFGRNPALRWLFNVCQPKQLTVQNYRRVKTDRFLACLTEAIRLSGNPVNPVKQLVLDLRLPHPQHCVGHFGRFLQVLSTSVTHLEFGLDILRDDVSKYGPIVATWLSGLPNLQILWCRLNDRLRKNEIYAQYVVQASATLSKLTGFFISGAYEHSRPNKRVTNLLNRHRFGTVSNLCCDCNVYQLKEFCEMSERARLNVTTICCVWSYGIVDLSTVLSRFPNCRQMFTGRMFTGERSITISDMENLCTANNSLHSSDAVSKRETIVRVIKFEKEGRWQARITRVEKQHLVEIIMDTEVDADADHCTLLSHFRGA